MNQTIIHVGLDVDDTQYHGSKAFSASTPEPTQTDAQLVKSHQEISDTDKAIMAATVISIKDIKKHGIAGGENSEINKAGRAIGNIFGW